VGLSPILTPAGGTVTVGPGGVIAMTRIVSDLELDDATVSRLTAKAAMVVQLPHHGTFWDLPDELTRGTRILLCKYPPKQLDHMADLELMQISTVGYEHLKHLGLADRPLAVCNARGLFDTAIAEWNLAMMVNLTRDLRGLVRNQEQGRWDRSARFQQEIRGRVLGLWGYGGIGRETARLAKAFGLTVHVQTRTGVRPRRDTFAEPGTGDPEGVLPDRVFVAGQERDFLSGLDFLVLALPHTKHSDGLLGEAEFQTLPPTAFVLNPARGPIIQEAALLRALNEGWIAGAALDTHFAYPLPPDHPLWAMPNVILTPHVSGADRSRHFPVRMAELVAQNVTRHLDGRSLLNRLTPDEWREA
jgi:phosphoglycerate dehydrogenase-like enzyme